MSLIDLCSVFSLCLSSYVSCNYFIIHVSFAAQLYLFRFRYISTSVFAIFSFHVRFILTPLPLSLYSSFSVFLMSCFHFRYIFPLLILLYSSSSIFVTFSLISILLYSLSSILLYSPSSILVIISLFHFRYILPLPFVIFSLFRFCYILSPCPYIFYLAHWFSCLPILHFYPTPLFCFVSRQLIKIKKMGELIN